MAKRALLVGCNYPGTDAELNGCVNDVFRMKELLLTRFGFDERDIVVMIDTDEEYPQPTGANIRKGLQKIIANTDSGDVLFMHYSGHGTRVPPESGEEDDTGFDECIVPTDMNVLSDNDFRDLVNKLPQGVMFTMVTDCCHSGGLIDHAEEQIGDSVVDDEGDNATREFQPPGQRTRDFNFGGGDDRGQSEYGGGYNRTEGHGRSGYGEQEDYRRGGAEHGHGREEYGRGPGEEYGREERHGRRPEYDRESEGHGYGRHEYGGRDDEGPPPRGGEYGGGNYRPSGRDNGERYGGRNEGRLGGYGGGHPSRIPMKNRSMGSDMLMTMLKMKYGKTASAGLRPLIYSVFGEDSSPMVQAFAGVLISQAPTLLQSMGGGGASGAALSAILSSMGGEEEKKQSQGGFGGMLSAFTGKKEEEKKPEPGGIGGFFSKITGGREEEAPPPPVEQPAAPGGLAGMALSFLKTQMAGGGQLNSVDDLMAQATPLAQQVAQGGDRKQAYAGYKPPPEARVRADLGILISGCQSDETSADANPDNNPKTAYGALSNAINEVLAEHDGPIGNRDLVMKVRQKLKTQGFAQNPGLYCDDTNLNGYFISS